MSIKNNINCVSYAQIAPWAFWWVIWEQGTTDIFVCDKQEVIKLGSTHPNDSLVEQDWEP